MSQDNILVLAEIYGKYLKDHKIAIDYLAEQNKKQAELLVEHAFKISILEQAVKELQDELRQDSSETLDSE